MKYQHEKDDRPLIAAIGLTIGALLAYLFGSDLADLVKVNPELLNDASTLWTVRALLLLAVVYGMRQLVLIDALQRRVRRAAGWLTARGMELPTIA